jgi:hypothetical protein
MKSNLALKSFQDFIYENLDTKSYYQNLFKSSYLKYHLTLDIKNTYRSENAPTDLLNAFLASLNESILRTRYLNSRQYINGFTIKESRPQNYTRIHVFLLNKKTSLPVTSVLDRIVSKSIYHVNRETSQKTKIKNYELNQYDKEQFKINATTRKGSGAEFNLYNLSHRQIINDFSYLKYQGAKFTE